MKRMVLAILTIGSGAGAAPLPEIGPHPIRIGVSSSESPDRVRAAWGPTADYLSKEIPSSRFEIVPCTASEAEEAVKAGLLDFILLDPAEYVRLEMDHGIYRVLTRLALRRGVACDEAGSVVVTASARGDLRGFADLEGKRIAAVSADSFEGWIAAAHDFWRRGIDPARNFASVSHMGSAEAVAQAILQGEADAGTMGSADLARLIDSGVVEELDLLVLEPRLSDLIYPLESTTPLFPEWPLAALARTEDYLSSRVVLSLLKLGARDPASLAAGTAGWTTAESYWTVHRALRDLRLRPYNEEHVALRDAVREFRSHLLGAALIFFGLIVATAYVVRLYRTNARLASGLEKELAERERAERALGQSESLYHSLVETLPQNIFRKSRDERFTFVNRRFCATLGKPAEEILGRTDADLFPTDLAEKYRADDALVMTRGTPYETIERHVTAEGDVLYVHVIKSPVVDAEGAVAGVQGIFWDVTGKKRAEERLARSEERFSLAVRGSNDGLWDWNLEAGEIYYSPRFKELLGYPDHEFPNSVEAHMGRIHAEDLESVLGAIRSHLKHKAPFDVEYRLRTRPGEHLWFHARGQAIWNGDGRATRMAGSLSDITLRKISEEKLKSQNIRLQEMARSERRAHQDLKQAQSRMVSTAKLAGLGEMVAGVAHEINNPLSFVSNNVCVLQRDLAEVAEVIAMYRVHEGGLEELRLAEVRALWDRVDMGYTLENLPGLLNRTRDGLKRIQQIVKDLRVFARLDESDLSEVDLNIGIESTVNIVLGHAKKKQVRIDLDLRPLPPVTCFPAKINQVIMNLVSNAIDASPEEGTIVVRSDSDPDGDGVVVEVRDHGTGIAPEVRERIFDPFFTTKPVGVGTGLGLSISYGIIQDHGGTIEVESEPEMGAMFSIHLPTKPPTVKAPPAPEAPALAGSRPS